MWNRNLSTMNPATIAARIRRVAERPAATDGTTVCGENCSIPTSTIRTIAASTARMPSQPSGAPVAERVQLTRLQTGPDARSNHGKKSNEIISNNARPAMIQSRVALSRLTGASKCRSRDVAHGSELALGQHRSRHGQNPIAGSYLTATLPPVGVDAPRGTHAPRAMPPQRLSGSQLR